MSTLGKEDPFIKNINNFIQCLNESGSPTQYISDGYHSFDDLYMFRMLYNAALFNTWAMDITYPDGTVTEGQNRYNVHKSERHHDGELCFGGGWFIVVAVLPTGQISNHYKMDYWDYFNIPVAKKALFPFDGHTPEDVMERLTKLVKK